MNESTLGETYFCIYNSKCLNFNANKKPFNTSEGARPYPVVFCFYVSHFFSHQSNNSLKLTAVNKNIFFMTYDLIKK